MINKNCKAIIDPSRLLKKLYSVLLPAIAVCFFISCQNEAQKAGETKDTATVGNATSQSNAGATSVIKTGTDSTNPLLPEMIAVKGGTFKMGNNASDREEEKPEHSVTLSNYSIGKYEVTVGEFRRFMNTHAYTTDAEKEGLSYVWDGKDLVVAKNGVTWECDVYGNKHVNEENHPVTHISRYDAEAYCKWLSKETGKTYRLLTEAEWEYAAKGGPHHDKYTYSGSNDLDKVGWYDENSGLTTHPVGQKTPNSLSIHDMSGNVWEFCADFFGPYTAEKQTDPKGPATGENGILRGGAWRWYDVRARCTSRRDIRPHFNASGIGFRLACSEK